MMKKVTMYYKVTCPYCVRAERLLRERGVNDLEKISIDTNREQRAAMIERSGGRTTVPQIFIDQTHIGGCDDLMALDRDGKLVTMLGA
ncbi:glutaredoxin-3 [Advenella mimigardefordensis DPN7]|uniref:Glutaredoxin n=2 Tax=Advenella mimigardefordensis TaxID=302406 RepID=W0PCS8_ADVMD|nr:glutaredoxin-3 [Advenella mimigardefordensis DPN7]